MKEVQDVFYGEHGNAQSLSIYLPDSAPQAVFVYFHGGGLESGDKKRTADIFAPYLTERGIAVVSANYRMYPDAEYPDFIFDAASAVAYAHGHMKELGCDKLYVGGSSAGGYLSMMLCFDGQYLASVGLDNSAIAGYFHDAGQPTAHFNVLKHSGLDSRRIIVNETAPLYHVVSGKEYPPMRFVVSDNDMKGRYEQTMLMLATLSNFGYKNFDHVVMHGKHCEYCTKLDESGDSVLGKMIFDFIKGRR